MYDAIVVGARCAGASTALLLARRGLDVLLVDRATFPREIPHGHFIHLHGPRRLRDWGLLDRVLATGCPPVTETTLDFGDFPLTARRLEVDGVPMGLGPRRARLDQILIDAAVEAGAGLREGFAVEALTRDGGRVSGIRGRSRGARAATERARVVIGADGRNSLVAREVGAPITHADAALSCWYFSYWSGVPARGLEIVLRDERAVFAFPTNDGLFGVFVAWPLAELPAVRANVEAAFMAVLDAVPAIGERVRAGRREERFYGATQLPNHLRRPYGPGWALVGDAGCHKDPLLALGVCDALRDAEALADAVTDGLAGNGGDLDDRLADYGRRRDEATLPDYRENLLFAGLQPLPPEIYALRAALRGNEAATRHFQLARERLVAPESFFNPENLRALMAPA